MSYSITIEGMEEVQAALENLASGGRLESALAAAGEVVRAAAVENAPVDTGTLEGSISCNVADNAAVIGTNVEYAPYVEFGTGSKGDKSVAHTTKKILAVSKNGRWYTTSGQAPHPFLVPALKNNVAKIIAEFKRGYKNG
ncbi:MAG: HK97 gp10 family phage protein [Oscillospiraceae bacterium]|nr:HK97 gp10 family phage protein [Oscillospiraceae bacterium]